MLLFVDGFDYYTSADLDKKWTSVISDTAAPSVVTPGRYGVGTGCLKLGNTGAAGVTKAFASKDNIVVGFAFKATTLTGSDINLVTLFSDAATPFAQAQLRFTSGVLTYYNGQRNSYHLASGVTLTAGTWYYIEFKITVKTSSSAGETQVRLNGVTVIDVPTAINTQGDFVNAINTFNRVYISGTGTASTANLYIDDLYICDKSGSFNNDFLGDVRIETIYPDGAGSSSQFTPLSGTNWSQVSESPQDGDTSYVSSATMGNKDIYTLSDLSSSPTDIYGIQISTIARKADSGPRVIAPIVKSGGTEYDHSSGNAFGLADDYTQHLDLWELNPDGSVPWTGTSINALNTGVKVIL